MEPRLIQTHTQKLLLSPQIRQYLRLLQLPLSELSLAIEKELAENPLLEESGKNHQEESPDREFDSQRQATHEVGEFRAGESFDNLQQMDDNFQEACRYPDFAGRDLKEMQKKRNFQESLIEKPQALGDFLDWQIRFLNLPPSGQLIAEEIVGNVDPDGYLRTTVEELARTLNVEPQAVAAILEQIQQLDPPGVGARDLQEALLLQLKRKGPEAALAEQIVRNHLPLLEKRSWQEVARVLDVNIAKVHSAASLIAHLDPKPGRSFYEQEPITVTPDATVSFSDDDTNQLEVTIHDEVVPELRINPYYRRLLRQPNLDPKTKTFIREKMQTAVNFMKALGQRKSTLRAITEELVRVQPEFFEKGFSHLRPLRLKDVAETLGFHESTVSRAINGKYVATPQGTIPYKSFFSTRLETADGGMESQKSIMEKIRALIRIESPEQPLSDEKLVKVLRQDGLIIARRTVAKYRDLLKILPSHLRRRK